MMARSSSKAMARVEAKVRVRPLRKSDWPTIERLFGANGACGGCWCMAMRLPTGTLYKRNQGEPNRRAFKKLVTSGKAIGLLAFAGVEPVGWCSTGPRADHAKLQSMRSIETAWDERTWATPCFFIKSGWRGKGVASALLKGALALAKARGAREVEAYPAVPSGSFAQRMPATFAWTGVPRLFERAGFTRKPTRRGKRPVYAKRVGR
jgi:GNAT superfamily N-acetyltransferase